MLAWHHPDSDSTHLPLPESTIPCLGVFLQGQIKNAYFVINFCFWKTSSVSRSMRRKVTRPDKIPCIFPAFPKILEFPLFAWKIWNKRFSLSFGTLMSPHNIFNLQSHFQKNFLCASIMTEHVLQIIFWSQTTNSLITDTLRSHQFHNNVLLVKYVIYISHLNHP